jgi:hypothetical protein
MYLDVEEGELQSEFPSGLEHDDEKAHQTLVVTDYHGTTRLAVQVELLHLAAADQDTGQKEPKLSWKRKCDASVDYVKNVAPPNCSLSHT